MYLGMLRTLKVSCLAQLCAFIASLFVVMGEAQARQCIDIFVVHHEVVELIPTDAREEYVSKGVQGFMKVGEGNSGSIFLFKNANGEFKVAKFYKPERAANLERDHLGLQEVQMMFDKDRFHSVQFRVAKSEILENLRSENGGRALVMDYYPGFNLHSLLISTPKNHPLHIQAETLYQKLVKELDYEAHLLGLRDEIRPETDKYFQDHIIDGLPMLIIEGHPRLLIKTDNIIFNPVENTLTLIDPY